MPLDYNGRSFILSMNEAPPFSIQRLGKAGVIKRINYEYKGVYLRSTPYFYSNCLELLEGVRTTQAAEEHIERLSKQVELRHAMELRSLRLKNRVPDEEEYEPSYHGFKASKLRLFRSQIIGIDLCAYMRRYALFFEQRCGKTLCMLGAYNRICRDDNKDYRMLVFTGKSIMHVWEEHINEFMEGVHHIRIYEELKNKPHLVDKLTGKVIAVTTHTFSSDKKFNLIKRFNPNIIVLDESQAFKNASSIRSRNIMKISYPDTMRFCLSGTPSGQGYIDFYAQLNWLYPYNFPPTKSSFMNRFCHVYERNRVKIISGYKDVGKIRKIVKYNSFRVRQHDNFEVPNKRDVMIYVQLDDDTLTSYLQFKRKSKIMLDNKLLKVKNPLVLLNKLRQFLGGIVIASHEDSVMLHQVSTEKLKALKSYLMDNKPSKDNKIVIYCVFIHEIDMICDMLNDMRISHERISGKVNLKNRERIIHEFQNKDDPSVIIGQVKTLSAGIKLSRSSRVLFYSPDFSYQTIEQAKERIVDTTQKRDVDYIYLVVKNTVDEKIIRLLSKLKKQTDYILDS